MSAPAEALFGNKPSTEAKEAREGFSVSYQINHSELIFGRELGRGGFGIVYQGTWRKHTDVAIKQLLSDDISSEAKEEFDTESRVMARLHSPHIVQFYGYCLSPRRCIVMEHMPNGSLYSVLKNIKQPLDWSIRIRIAIDMASGLAFLHQEHIIHRDIKSLNVLLNKSYGAKLTDFGLSKVKTESKSQSMATRTSKDAVGTIAWMAPELFERRAIYTQKSDIYSLGITFWELAARKIPFADASNPALIPSWVSKGDREDIPKDCPQKLASLIAACWEGSPAKRPDADAVVTYLKSEQTNFAQFLPLLAAHRSEYQSNLHSSPAVTAGYQDNFNSALSGLKSLQVSPPVTPEQKNPSVSATLPQNQTVKPAPRVSASDLQVFLRLVAEGEQDKAEAMLKSNTALALVSGDVTDLSKRTFNNITGFQYAVWALDWHMWTMIRKYLPDNEAKQQAEGFETGAWVKQHRVHAQHLLDNLVNALQTTIDSYNAKKGTECRTAWVQKVGGAQLLLPAHVINEYCHPSRSFVPVPNFREAVILPRTRTTRDPAIMEWFTAGVLGEKFAVFRGEDYVEMGGGNGIHAGVEAWDGIAVWIGEWWGSAAADEWAEVGCGYHGVVAADRVGIHALSGTRTTQREELIAELKPKIAQRRAA